MKYNRIIESEQFVHYCFFYIICRKIGFYGVFSLAGSLYLLALLYGIFILKEVPSKVTTNQPTVKKSFLADFFDLNHIKETFSVAFRKGPRQRRAKILALMAVIIIAVGPQHGEMSLFYLFTRYKFNWSEVEFSIFATYSVVVHLIGIYYYYLASDV